jgi:hypothetical protein
VPQLNKTFELVSFDERLKQLMNHFSALLIMAVPHTHCRAALLSESIHAVTGLACNSIRHGIGHT